ncbi:MAG: class I SAM-dependent RNA methyltransferase [Cytophagales bacterium]|nr:MAG: class I SAM-dependent RNA methyltransferase [Cytophagales bacterium]
MSDPFNSTSEIFVACPIRIAPYLYKEIINLGYTVEEETPTGIKLIGTMQDCIRLNLSLRTAYRVLFFVKKFYARNANDLYKEIRKIEWENIIPNDGYFTVQSFANNETINDSRFPALRTKDAIADRFVEIYRKRPNSGAEKSGAAVYIHWEEEQVNVYIDTSGATISKHGYRKMPFKAPMIEGLAAATILASEWNMLTPFVNPMCGSGTLAIEAAMMAANIAPGLIRDNYAFMHLVGYEDSFFIKERLALKKLVKTTIPSKIIASDHNGMAIDAAKHNASEAGVAHLIEFQECDFRTTKIEENAGVVIINPEYGARLGDQTELENTYKSMGDFFKQNCKGYHCFVFTGNPELAKKIGLKASRKIEFYNSTIDCRLLKFEMYDGTKRERFKEPTV